MMRRFIRAVSKYVQVPTSQTSRHFAQEIDEELAFHLEQRTQDYVQRGMSEQEARHRALQKFGDVPEIARQCHDASFTGLAWIHRLHLAATAALSVCVLLLLTQWVFQRKQGIGTHANLPPAVQSLMNEDWTGDVHGHVVSESGKVIANAKVLMAVKTWPGGSFFQRAYATKTGPEGKFQVNNVCPVNDLYEVQIAVVAENFEMQSSYHSIGSGTLDALTFQLPASESFRLQVEDASGRPIPGVQVMPHQRVEESGEQHVVYFDSGESIVRVTDEKGQVAFPYFREGDGVTVLVETTQGNWEAFEIRVPESDEVAAIRTEVIPVSLPQNS